LTHDSKVFLIGGTSHVGKSTFARRLASQLGWNYLSTDQFARHPGRPWRDDQKALPDDVVEHYSNLTTDALVDSVLNHYALNVWPIADAIVRSHLNNPYDPSLVLEGSAILPDRVRAADYDRVAAIWLTGTRELIKERIRRSSRYETRTAFEKRLIDSFVARSLAIDRALMASVEENKEKHLDVGSANAFDALSRICRIESG
jgi:2-phosphoglycerate kinase